MKLNYNGSKIQINNLQVHKNNYLEDELSELVDDFSDPEMIINLTRSDFEVKGFLNCGNKVFVSSDQVILIVADFKLKIYEKENCINIDVFYNRNTSKYWMTNALRNLKAKITSKPFYNHSEHFTMRFVEWVLHPMLLLFGKETRGILHASSVINTEGNAYIFTGTGGVGKSSSQIDLVMYHRYKFLADDWSFLDNSSNVFFNPKSIKVFPYNTEGNELLYKKLMQERTFLNRLYWKFKVFYKGPSSQNRPIYPKLLYKPESVGVKALTEKVFFLIRGNLEDIQAVPVGHEELAYKCVQILKTEYLRFFSILYFFDVIRNFTSVDIPKTDDVFSRYYDFYKDFFSNTSNYIVQVPRLSNPKTLTEFILKLSQS